MHSPIAGEVEVCGNRALAYGPPQPRTGPLEPTMQIEFCENAAIKKLFDCGLVKVAKSELPDGEQNKRSASIVVTGGSEKRRERTAVDVFIFLRNCLLQEGRKPFIQAGIIGL